jgi:hypothetical protein
MTQLDRYISSALRRVVLYTLVDVGETRPSTPLTQGPNPGRLDDWHDSNLSVESGTGKFNTPASFLPLGGPG